MKKLLSLTLLIVFASFSGFGQKTKKADVPEYLFAENAPFIVMFMTTMRMLKVTRSGAGVAPVMYTRTVEEFDPAKLESHDDKLLLRIFQLVNEEFKALGLKPSAYVAMDQAELMVDYAASMEKLRNSLEESKAQYLFVVSLPRDLYKARKAIIKDKFTLENVEPVALSISKMASGKSQEIVIPYMINKVNMTLAEGFKRFKKDIDDKPKDYFIKKLETEDLAAEMISKEEADEFMDFWQGGDSLDRWPSDLLESTLLVWDPQQPLFERKEKDIEKTFYFKKFTADYPGKFITISNHDISEYREDPKYKYIMLMQVTEMKKYTSTTHREGDMMTKTKERVEAMAYCFLKDIRTGENYHTALGIEALVENAAIRQVSVKYFLKIMKEYYKWE